MSDLPAQLQTRLLELERKQARLAEALADLRRQAIGAGQDWWQLEMDRRRRTATPVSPPTPDTKISGNTRGCNNLGIPAGIAITETATGAILWTGTSSGTGAYSATFPMATNTALTFTMTPVSSHLAVSASSLGTIVAGSTTVVSRTTGAATGFHCISGGCAIAYNNTVNCFDHRFSINVAMAWNGVDRWTGAAGGRTYALTSSGIFLANGTGTGGPIGPACSPTYTYSAIGVPPYTNGDLFDITDTP